jgi:hypothetical protein
MRPRFAMEENCASPHRSEHDPSLERATRFPAVLNEIRFRLRKPLIVFGVSSAGETHVGNGALSELPADATIEICGPGFSAHTVHVRLDGQQYVAFLRDLERRSGWSP